MPFYFYYFVSLRFLASDLKFTPSRFEYLIQTNVEILFIIRGRLSDQIAYRVNWSFDLILLWVTCRLLTRHHLWSLIIEHWVSDLFELFLAPIRLKQDNMIQIITVLSNDNVDHLYTITYVFDPFFDLMTDN